MNRAILDDVECSCGCSELKVEGEVSRKTENQPRVTRVLCQKFCAYKQCAIAAGSVNPEICQECRSKEILGGTIRCECGLEWKIEDGSPRFAKDARVPYEANGLRVSEIDWNRDPRVRSFVAGHPEGTIFQHPSWLEILNREYRQNCLTFACEDSNGKLHAVLPLMYTKGLPRILGGTRTTRRLSSLPRTPLAGSLALQGPTGAILMRAAVERVRREPGLQLEIKTQSAELEGIGNGVACAPWRFSYVLDLPSDPSKLKLGDTHKRRHRLRGALKKATLSGLRVRKAESERELEAWYELYLDTMRRRIVPPRPYRFFQAMWEELRKRDRMELLIAEKSEAGRGMRLVAGSIFLKFGGTVFYSFTGCRRADFFLHPHDLIQWKAIQAAARESYRHYDFGEVAQDCASLANFKSKWGAERRLLYRYYFPVPEEVAAASLPVNGWLKGLAMSVWRRLPLGATERLGDLLYGYL